MKTIKLEVTQVVNESGVLIIETYWLKNKYHNEHGPAFRRWKESGQLKYEYYYLKGKYYTKEEWQSKVNPDPCVGRVVTVDGKQYRLGEV